MSPMHSALQRAVWALRSPSGAAWAFTARSFWNAAEEAALRGAPSVAVATTNALPARLSREADADVAPRAAEQRGSLVALTQQALRWRPLPEGLSPFSLSSTERPAPQCCGSRQSGGQLRCVASRPHSVAGRRAAAAQQRARTRPPPPAAHASSAEAVTPAPHEGGGAAPPQQSQGPADEAAPSSTDAVQPLPASLHEVADVVNRDALLVTRDIEWGTVVFGFEQANKYTVLDQDGNTVALLAEEYGGLGKEIGRQFLRTHRAFTATVLTADGSHVICRIRRPLRFINSSLYIEDGTGAVVGEVHQRWHLWKRKYDLYLGKRQFAAIEGGFLAWEFALRDADGGVLALIDRNFQGFGKELFTDAGKYVIHFGETPQKAAEHVANTIEAAHPDKPRPQVTALAKARNDIMVIPTATGDQLDVVRPLGIDERTAVLAAAVSIDFDYFSQHSHSGGGLFPMWMMPMPTPSYPPPEAGAEGADVAGGAAGAEAGAETAASDSPGAPGQYNYPGAGSGSPPSGSAAEPFERDLGGDDWDAPGGGEAGGGGWGSFGGDNGGDADGLGGGDEEGSSVLGNIWDLFSNDD